MKIFVLDQRSSYLSMIGRMVEDWNAGTKRAERQKALRQSGLTIVNESNLTGGESVGASSTASAAPEVAASDDDGDGDGDPDPERRRPGRPRNTRNPLPSTVENFDRLPDSACVDIAALKAITGKSRATLYRWIDKGILPKPRKLGLTSNNVWAAGDIRRALSA